MSENNYFFHRRIIAIILAIHFLLFLSGCASYTYTYVSDMYPKGNIKYSSIDLKACSDKIAQYVKDNAKKTTTENKYVYIPGTPGITSGGVVISTSSVCKGACAASRDTQATTIIRCMYEKGWQWSHLK